MKLLDSVYELEGLLMLLESRDDLPSTFPSLIEAKAAAILQQARQLAADSPQPVVEQPPLPELRTAVEPPAQEEAAGESQPADVNEEEPEPVVIKSPFNQDKTGIRFSINDRIRFSRELFGGNTALFDSTIRFIEDLPDWMDVEDYFYTEQEWDPSRREVAEFTELLHHLYIRNKARNNE